MKQDDDIQVKNTDTISSEMETYNHAFFEAILDPLIIIDLDGNIKHANSASESAIGLIIEKLIDTEFIKYFNDSIKARTLFDKVFHDGKVFNNELELKNVAGYFTPVSCNASLYKDDEDSIIGIFVVLRDITNKKKTEDELIHLKNNLEMLIKQRSVELIIASKELAYESGEKSSRAAELIEAS